jgi:hypothetical protein
MTSGWRLCRQVPPQRGLPGELTFVREVNNEERSRLLEAERLLDRHGAGRPFERIVRSGRATAANCDALVTALSRASGVLNPADLNRVAWSLAAFAKDVTVWLEAVSAAPELADVLASASAVPAVASCRRLASPDAPRIVVHLDPAGEPLVAVAGDEASNDEPILGVVHLVTAALASISAVDDAQLTAIEPQLLVAGALVMGTLAEVVYGQPVLLRHEGRTTATASTPAKRHMTVHSVEVWKVAPVLLACAAARQAAIDQAAGVQHDTLDQDPAHAGVAIEPQIAVPAPTVTGDPDTSEAGGPVSTAQHVASASVDAAPLDDVEAFLVEATNFALTTEQRWSGALGAAIGEDAADVRARGESVLGAVYQQILRDDAHVCAAGYSTRLPSIPLTVDDANGLQLAPKGQQQVTQREVASIQVVQSLLQALSALQGPTHRRLDLRSGRVSSWWRQDVFVRVHEQSALAARTILLAPLEPSAWRELAEVRAQQAWDLGMVEAAGVYLVNALDPEVEATGPLARAHVVLREAAARVASGTAVPLDALVPLVVFWLEELQRRAAATSGGAGARDETVRRD